MLIHTKWLRYVDGHNGCIARSTRHSVRQKDRMYRPSTVTESFGVSRPLRRRIQVHETLTMTWCWQFSVLYAHALIISWLCFSPTLFALIASIISRLICSCPCAIFSILLTSTLDAISSKCLFVNFPSAIFEPVSCTFYFDSVTMKLW